MSKNVRLCFVLFIVLMLATSCNNQSPIKDPLNYQVQSFQYTNQNKQTISLEDLKGDVWLANFIFTSCDTVCPPMTAHMSELQQRLKSQDVKAKIISFSVDPETDTPKKLIEYTKSYNISFDTWSFLTGYKQKEIEEFALNSFKTIVKKPTNTNQVIHGTSFYLVDQRGIVMKDYNGVEDPPYDQIIKDIKSLLEK